MRIRRRLSVTAILLLLATSAAAEAAAQNRPTLYARMGGYDRIAAVIDDFLGRFDADPALAPFLGGINAVEGARIRQHFVDFLCHRTGGPCLYNGRDMKITHEGLPITEAHFAAVTRHFDAALEKQGVPAPERREVMTMLQSLREMIVQRPASSP